MDKQEAMLRLDTIESEAKELRRIIESPEVDYNSWIGKWGFFSDTNASCPGDGIIGMLTDYDKIDKDIPFCIGELWYRYFRPATPEELGFSPTIEPDWSKAPEWANWWAMDEDGTAWWYENKTYCKENEWTGTGNCMKVSRKNDGWRDTLRERPKQATK